MSRFSVPQVKTICEAEMSKFGLLDKGWKFETDNSTHRLGFSKYYSKIVGLSTYFIEHSPDETVIDTIRHEIAHALHYEWCNANGVEYDERIPKYRRGRTVWVRKIKPHGPEWKRFARMTGANPKATANGDAPPEAQNWRAVFVKDGIVTDSGRGCQRFLVRVESRWVEGYKHLVGHMYLVEGMYWSQVLSGKRDINNVWYFQKRHKGVRFNNLTLSN